MKKPSVICPEKFCIMKYCLDQGASMYCRLSSKHYFCSHLDEGGLEIECQMVINSPAAMLHSKLTGRYLHLVKVFPQNLLRRKWLGSYLAVWWHYPSFRTLNINIPMRKKEIAIHSWCRDIKEILASPRQNRNKTKIIITDYNINKNIINH